jgi:spermidine synthase
LNQLSNDASQVANHDVTSAVTQDSEPRTSDWQLRVIVFVSGAVLMGLEMTGSRVLAIHFGSSIYVWGAIIGIFLAALSLGYYSGGMLADRKPALNLLNLLLLIGGVWLLLVPFFANRVCLAVLSLNPGERVGPLLATVLLFGGPSVLLGMVSPFAVRLAARTIESMGNVSGRLYALSTFGSIAGTLLTAFWLIPAVGARTLLQVLGLFLVLLPLVSLPKTRLRLTLFLVLLVVVPLLFVLNSGNVARRANQTVVFETDSPYHYILVVDDKQRNARYLQFNNYVEGAIDLNPPHDTRVSYTNAFHLARIFKSDLKRILIIGGGGGIGARKFVTDDEKVEVDLVEIDPEVVDLSFKYFHLEPSQRLRVHLGDGRTFVRRATVKYDLVILDAFTIGGQIPFHLTTKEFMQEIKRVLTPDGAILANINGTMRGPRSRIMRAEYKTLSQVFDSVYVFPHLHDIERNRDTQLDLDRNRSIILVAVDGANLKTRETIESLARQLEQTGVVRTPTFVEDARQLFTSQLHLDDVPLLIDDYAPVDTMVR